MESSNALAVAIEMKWGSIRRLLARMSFQHRPPPKKAPGAFLGGGRSSQNKPLTFLRWKSLATGNASSNESRNSTQEK